MSIAESTEVVLSSAGGVDCSLWSRNGQCIQHPTTIYTQSTEAHVQRQQGSLAWLTAEKQTGRQSHSETDTQTDWTTDPVSRLDHTVHF